MQTLKAFIRERGIRATAEWADDNPSMDDMPPGSSHWRVTLRMGRKRMTVPFSMGPAHSTEPSAYDVLSCLASDAASVENVGTFDEWAEDLGWSADSRKAERAYRATVAQTARLRAFLDEAYAVLLWGVEPE